MHIVIADQLPPSAIEILRTVSGWNVDARTSRKSEFRDYAERTLVVMALRAAAEGPLAAEYVLSVRDTGE